MSLIGVNDLGRGRLGLGGRGGECVGSVRVFMNGLLSGRKSWST